MNFRKIAVGVIGLFFASAVAAGVFAEELEEFTGGAGPEPAPEEEDLVARASIMVHDLDIAAETDRDSYDRDAFGSGWSTEEGCSTRATVLIEQSITEATVTDGCTVVEGEWDSWYDGEILTDPGDIDIDHLVPLAEAWASGASDWSDEQRRDYYNDLGTERPDGLTAVSASSNREKSDSDPADWMPDEVAAHCRYVASWVVQKHHWDLAADQEEHDHLVDVLGDCVE